MKKILLVSLIMACLPVLTMAQDDLYFVPKKKVEKKAVTGTPAKVVVESKKAPTTVYNAPATTVVVKDVKGNVRDVDEYNRRYTSRDNTFEVENDTLYIEEKPYNERGEWVNGFEGTQDDYEYAMRIIRFRNPRYAIPVSSPLYWDVIYSLPSWEWNVFDDGLYAYAFPTYSNHLWWDWRWNYPYGSSWALGGWYSPWFNHWYGNYWYGSWGGYWGHHHHHHYGYPHHHHGPMYAGVGGYWGGGHGRFGSSATRPGIHAGRYSSNISRNNLVTSGNRRQVAQNSSRNGGDSNVGTRQVRRSATGVNRSAANRTNVNRGEATQNVRRTTAGRVVRSNDNANSVRPRTTAVRTRNGEAIGTREAAGVRSNGNSYVRSTESRGSSYNRPSSTRSSVTNRSNSTYQQRSASSSDRGGTYRSSSSSRSSRNNATYRSNSSSSSRSSGSSFSSGGGSSRSSSAGGGGSRSGGGGSSRGSRR